MRGKILVIRGGAIGDFILTLPAITALRGHFPEAHLEILGYPHIAQLALAAKVVDRVQGIEARGLAGFFARKGDLSEELADYFSEFDVILSFLYDPDRIFQENVARCTKAQFITGPHRAQDAEPLHATKVYLKPLERLAIFDADTVPNLFIGEPSSPLHQLALHPGSGSPIKNWPEEKWAELLRYLSRSTDYRFLLIGGEAEGERLERLSRIFDADSTRLQLAQSLPLIELAGLIQRCKLFIGHDSGISHLAAALGLPGLILWANTPLDVWRPPSKKVRILQHPTVLEALPLDTVIEAFHELERGIAKISTTPTS